MEGVPGWISPSRFVLCPLGLEPLLHLTDQRTGALFTPHHVLLASVVNLDPALDDR